MSEEELDFLVLEVQMIVSRYVRDGIKSRSSAEIVNTLIVESFLHPQQIFLMICFLPSSLYLMVGDVQAQVAKILFLTQNDLLQISFVYLSLRPGSTQSPG